MLRPTLRIVRAGLAGGRRVKFCVTPAVGAATIVGWFVPPVPVRRSCITRDECALNARSSVREIAPLCLRLENGLRASLLMLERTVVGIESVGLQHRDPTRSLALGLGGRLAHTLVDRLRVSQTFGHVMLYIRVVLGGARLDPLRLTQTRDDEDERQGADDRGQARPVAQFHDAPRAAPRVSTCFAR